MKRALLIGLALYCTGLGTQAQSLSSTTLLNILKGSYTPTAYYPLINGKTPQPVNPDTVAAGLMALISPDSLKANLIALRSFQNRNSGNQSASATKGITAAQNWALSKFQQYALASGSRLQSGFFNFTQTICSKTSHRNVIAMLPGNQVADKSVILVEAHLDSRCESSCDIACNAFGADDDGSGVALVLELARVLSRYTFKNTFVFSLNTGEEQGLYGSTAFANFCTTNKVAIKAVQNNDVAGNIFCGHTSNAPSCPFYGAIDSIGLRIFSYGGNNSLHKQYARYVKLQYQKRIAPYVDVVTDIRIMTPEDRTGRSGDHVPFRTNGFTAIRLVEANENGNGAPSASYVDRQHSVRDSAGIDTDGDGIEDSMYVNTRYLARNALLNGNAMAMAALSPAVTTFTATVTTANNVRLTLSGNVARRIAVRSATNDWDTLYTIPANATTATIKVPYGSNTSFFISAAAMDANNIESLFGGETTLTTKTVTTSAAQSVGSNTAAVMPQFEGIQLLQNKPNPFDEATTITVVSGTDQYANRAYINISTVDGKLVKRMKVTLNKGANEIMYTHGYGVKGAYICTLLIDGLPVQSKKMIFR